MMSSLFSCFEPSCGIQSLSLNWIAMAAILLCPTGYFCLPSRVVIFTQMGFFGVSKELLTTNKTQLGSSMPLTFSATFLFILLNNFFGLLPYVFTSTSHMCITLTMSSLLWVSLILPAVFNTPSLFLAHLVPKGTPIVLVPFMVMIELMSNIMRPFTLGIRLAANMVAGHLLLVLTSSPVYNLNFSVMGGVLVALFSLTVLELAVSVIQSYVFMSLSSLYVSEVSHTTLN